MYFINNHIRDISNNEDISNTEFVDEDSFFSRYMEYCNSTFYKVYNISLSVFFFIYYTLSLYFYLKYRKHYLIKNKQVLLCVTVSCICEVYCVLFPLTKIYIIDCWLLLWLTWFTATPKMIFNIARFLRLTLLQSKDRFLSNFLNLKCLNSVGSSNFQFLEESPDLYQGSSKEIMTTNIEKISFEPNIYYMIINKITQGRIGGSLIIIPTCLFIGYCILLTINYWDVLGHGTCSMDSYNLNKVFFFGFILYIIALPFIGYQTFKYSHTIRKFDYISYVICLLIGFGSMVLGLFYTIENIFLTEVIGLTNYLMFVGAHFGAIIIPLIEVHLEKKKFNNGELSLNKYEFQRLIMDHNYFAMLREFSIQLFCVENVLFWEMNFELLYKVDRYLISKKKILVEREKDKKIKSQKSLANVTRNFTQNLIKTVSTDEKSRNRRDSIDSTCSIEHSYNMRQNISNLRRNSLDTESRSRRNSIESTLPIVSDNINNSKFQNFEDLKETLHLNRRAQLFKRYILDMHHDQILYINIDAISLNNENFPVEFQKSFKTSYDKLYQLFMDINAPTLLNIKEVTITSIKERINNNDYSFDMLMEALDEVLQLLYDNVYPRIHNLLSQEKNTNNKEMS